MQTAIENGSAISIVSLETDDGEFVEAFEVPGLKACPNLMTWGDRVFRLVKREGQGAIYRELLDVFTLVEHENARPVEYHA